MENNYNGQEGTINWGEQAVGSIVAKLPSAADVFKANKIDFCCGGQRLLSTAIAEQQIPAEKIFKELDAAWAAMRESAGTVNYTELSQGALAAYIENQHHTFMHEALPVIAGQLHAVLKAHGQNHPELFKIYALFSQLKGELEQHLVKEEVLLFPKYKHGEGHDADSLRVADELKAEHEAAGKILKTLRELTNDYTVPADACGTFKSVYENLVTMESDLFQHIHLENNILLLK